MSLTLQKKLEFFSGIFLVGHSHLRVGLEPTRVVDLTIPKYYTPK